MSIRQWPRVQRKETRSLPFFQVLANFCVFFYIQVDSSDTTNLLIIGYDTKVLSTWTKL